jgi:hypothetical protein
MRQLIALVILVAIAAGGWMFWPKIKAMIVAHAEGGGQNEPEPKGPGPANPGTTTPGTTTPGATTPGTTTPGTTTPGTTTPGTTTPGTTTPGTTTPATTTPATTMPGTTTPGTSPTTPTSLKMDGPVTLHLRAVPDEKGDTFSLEGTTNLLPGTHLQLAITAGSGSVKIEPSRVEAGSPKNTFKTINHQLPDGRYQIDVIMYAGRQTDQELLNAYAQPGALKGPMVFDTREGVVVRATGLLQRARQRKAATEITLRGGTAKK